MRIGFASIYSWRPHVEHIHFLAQLAARGGHEVFHLTCDGDLPDCYTRELRDRARWLECAACRAGGIRSYARHGVSSIGSLDAIDSRVPEATEWALSSASTLGRFESDADYSGRDFAALVERLAPAVAMSHRAAREWIARNRLDAVCVFNGRMDATRAILEAAQSAGIRTVSVERTWFGDGLQLLPEESCLGLASVHRLVAEWKQRPLTRAQALAAAWPVARRFLRTNTREWRAYNTNATTAAWPVAGGRRRILLVPSSRNEVWGHPDWRPDWPSPLAAYDALIERLHLDPKDVVLRCHPNWGEKVGRSGGGLSERYYAEWARQRSIHLIASHDTASTSDLIAESDAIVVANGSAALEAGFLGRQVIGIAPSAYAEAGIRDAATTPAAMQSLHLWADRDGDWQSRRRRDAARHTLRFLYSIAWRIPQYADAVKATTTTTFRYDRDADPSRFTELLRTGRLEPDDATHADDAAAEDAVLDIIQSRRWEQLADAPVEMSARFAPLRRRPGFRLVDWVAQRKPVGDR